MAYSFSNPGHWKLGEKVTKGDIFQVQAEDSSNNAPGDYYKALRGFTLDANYYYPTQYHGSDTNWEWLASKDSWYSVTNVAVQTTDGGDSKYIYANGLNMVRIDVHMTPLNPAGEQITVDLGTLVNATYLINFDTLNNLIWKGENVPDIYNIPNDSGWMYTTRHNQFVDVSMNDNFADSETLDVAGFPGSTVVTFYVFAQNLDQSAARNGLRVSTTIVPSGNSHNKFIGAYDQLVSAPVQILVNYPVEYTLYNVKFDREDTGDGWHLDQDNYYLTISQPGHWLTAVSSTPGLQIGPDSWWFTKVWDSTRNWGYMWPFFPQAQYSTADVPVDDPLKVNFKYNEWDNAQCFTRIAIWDRDMVNDYNGGRNALYDTHFTIFDQYGNHGKFTAVKTEHGNRITLQEGWVSSDG